MGLFDWLRRTPTIDGEKACFISGVDVARALVRPRLPVMEAPPQAPCEHCGRAVEERVITTALQRAT